MLQVLLDDVLDPQAKSLGVNIAKKGIDVVDSDKNTKWFVVSGRNVNVLKIFQADRLHNGGGLDGSGSGGLVGSHDGRRLGWRRRKKEKLEDNRRLEHERQSTDRDTAYHCAIDCCIVVCFFVVRN